MLMKNKIIAVGPTTQNNTAVNGQSMMFQMLVDALVRNNIKHIVLDIGVSIFGSVERTSGKFSVYKAIDYSIILVKVFFICLFNTGQTIYITTAQSKVGFTRDYFIINIARLFGCNVIAHQFGANYAGFYNSQSVFLRKLIKNTLGKCRFIIVEGDYTKRQFNFLSDFESRVIALPNGLPQKIDSSDIKAKMISADKPVKLFYLSNLIETKGFWDVLEATAILNRKGIAVEAVFAGRFLESVDDNKYSTSKEAREAFLNVVNLEALTDKVLHSDGMFGEEKSKNFSSAHFFLLPSYYINEGQPVSVLEALAYGCVPIVTKHRLIPTMVNDDNGIFVEPQSPNQIADAIQEMILDPIKYNSYSQSGIDTYHNKFTANKYTGQLISILNQS